MATTTEPGQDIRAEHQAAKARLDQCAQRVRELNRAQLSEETVLVDQKQTMRRLRPDGSEAPAGDKTAWGVIVSHDVSG